MKRPWYFVETVLGIFGVDLNEVTEFGPRSTNMRMELRLTTSFCTPGPWLVKPWQPLSPLPSMSV